MSGSRGEDSYKGVGNQGKESVLSERLAFTGRIAASIAHEIRNPLGNVSMRSSSLRGPIAKIIPGPNILKLLLETRRGLTF